MVKKGWIFLLWDNCKGTFFIIIVLHYKACKPQVIWDGLTQDPRIKIQKFLVDTVHDYYFFPFCVSSLHIYDWLNNLICMCSKM